MNSQASIVDIITNRFSVRTYSGEPIDEGALRDLTEAAAGMRTGPFGAHLRFGVVAATPKDGAALKRLGTYGTIRGAAAFIIGAVKPGGLYLEDYGYAMERLVLRATELGLGTCWIGGFFNRGSFSRRIGAGRGERVPAVTSVGRIIDLDAARDGIMRRSVGGSRRKGWEELFHDGRFGVALPRESAGAFATALEMARLSPSASNRQPARIMRSGSSWHFYLRRTPGYLPRFARTLTGIEDLQRVDVGISMCHFELTLREQGIAGRWVVRPPGIPLPDELTEYTATWEG
jgi:nitroreductase